MPNYSEALSALQGYLVARVPLVALRSIEQGRALRLVREAASLPRLSSYHYSLYTRSLGLRDLRTNAMLTGEDRSLTAAMDHAAAMFTSRPNATVVFVEPESLTDDNHASRDFAELARLADGQGGSIVVVTDSPVWSGLSRLGMQLALELPDHDEMYDIIAGFLQDQTTIPVDWTKDDAYRAAEMLAGVTEGEAINMLATIASQGAVRRDDVTLIARRKDQIFGDLTGLERVTLGESDYAIGGLGNLRAWLTKKQQLIMADLRDTHLRPPRGVLLVGVPGCGKSLSAKAVAAQWELPLYRLDLASVLGQYVGQSEGRLREALDTADRVSPCVLWIDEIEKGLAGQNDSTGVGRRLIGQFLFWLQESSSRSFVVATANDVRSLPPELTRKGRFDEIFFVDLPSAEERREIIELYLRRYLPAQDHLGLTDELISLSEGFSGSDIESSLHEVGAEMYRTGATRAETAFVKDSFTNTVPFGRANPEQLEDIRAWGRDRAVPAGTSFTVPTDQSRPGRRIVLMDEGPQDSH